MVEPIDIRTGKPFASRRCHEHHLPPSDGASLGGGLGRERGLMGGLFGGCMMASQNREVSARSYVQDGLIVHFNCKENAGYGEYNPNATTWTDLSGNNRNGTLSGVAEWSDFGLVIKSKSQNGLVTFNGSHNSEHTVEIVYRCFDSYGPYGRILAENQWLCCGGMKWDQPYHLYGWGIDGVVLSGKKQNTAIPQTISIRDDGTKHPEIFNCGNSEGSFAATAYNLGNAISTLANCSTFVRGMDAAYMEVRIYNRCLTEDEIQHNADVDRQLFGTQYGDFAIDDCPYITRIGGSAFYGCASLTSVGDLTACTSIGSYAFYGCASLTSVGDLTACTSIGYAAFQGCAALTSVGDLTACTSIGSYAFYGCAALTRIYAPNVNSIGYSIVNCTHCRSVTLGNIDWVESGKLNWYGFFQNIGSELEPDEDGYKTTITLGCTMAYIRAPTGYTQSGYFPWLVPTQTKWVCSDGYISYDTTSRTWVNHPNNA